MTGADRSSGRTLTIQRTFPAARDKVFEAFTSLEVLRQWWPGGPGWTTSDAALDLRVGGRLRLVMHTPEGTEFGGVGYFQEISRPSRLVYSWQWDSQELGLEPQLVEITFTENPDTTTTVLLINHHVDPDEVERHHIGWQASFDKLSAVLAAGTTPANEAASPA